MPSRVARASTLPSSKRAGFDQAERARYGVGAAAPEGQVGRGFRPAAQTGAKAGFLRRGGGGEEPDVLALRRAAPGRTAGNRCRSSSPQRTDGHRTDGLGFRSRGSRRRRPCPCADDRARRRRLSRGFRTRSAWGGGSVGEARHGSSCHCERSEAISGRVRTSLAGDCFAALAMIRRVGHQRSAPEHWAVGRSAVTPPWRYRTTRPASPASADARRHRRTACRSWSCA